jgi:anti-sigma factor RsiW
MTHLTPEQLVEALEGQTSQRAGVAEHLATCERCQAELASMAETLGDVETWSMPEPSPLFWEHLSRRVRAATSDEALPLAPSWAEVWSRTWRPLAAVAAATGALALMFVLRSAHVSAPGTSPVGTPTAVAESTATTTPALDETNDEALNVMAVLAQDLRKDEVQQIARPSADATGAVIEDLTPAQRAELVKLIKSQTGGAE